MKNVVAEHVNIPAKAITTNSSIFNLGIIWLKHGFAGIKYILEERFFVAAIQGYPFRMKKVGLCFIVFLAGEEAREI